MNNNRDQTNEPNGPEADDMRLPPRRTVHSLQSGKATRIFQASLVVLLLLLTIGIIFWYTMYSGL